MTSSGLRQSRLVTAAELDAELANPRLKPRLKLIDASWYLPAQERDAKAEYAAERIPGAVFFDIDTIADTSSGLPHTLASSASFAEAVGQLGISEDDQIVVYDGLGLFSAPRVAWNLRFMGAKSVRVLDGGLPAWKHHGGRLDTAAPPRPTVARFAARPVAGSTCDREALQDHLKNQSAVIVDVRPADRFRGETPEPRAGMRSGHMPGAVNLPFSALLVNGHLAPDDVLKERFAAAGIRPDDLVVTSCGSGVTACVALLALDCIGHTRHALYDGSWSEWGGRSDTAVVTGT